MKISLAAATYRFMDTNFLKIHRNLRSKLQVGNETIGIVNDLLYILQTEMEDYFEQ